MALVGEAALLLSVLAVLGLVIRYAVKGVVWFVDNHEEAAACVGFGIGALLWGWAEPASATLAFVVAGLSFAAALFVVMHDMHQEREWIRRERDQLREQLMHLDADRG